MLSIIIGVALAICATTLLVGNYINGNIAIAVALYIISVFLIVVGSRSVLRKHKFKKKGFSTYGIITKVVVRDISPNGAPYFVALIAVILKSGKVKMFETSTPLLFGRSKPGQIYHIWHYKDSIIKGSPLKEKHIDKAIARKLRKAQKEYQNVNRA